MITEDYVSFEIAKLLRKKGFNVECTHCFALDTSEIQNIYDDITPGYELLHPRDWNHITEKELCQIGLSEWTHLSAPTLPLAMKWLREVHNCHICVQALITTDGLQGYCPFYTKVGDVFMWQNVLGDDYATTQTYEEACEAAIKYCLENLI